jgi:hypothetical protein
MWQSALNGFLNNLGIHTRRNRNVERSKRIRLSASKNRSWTARITFTDSYGKRQDIRRTAENKTAAKTLLKELVNKIEESGIVEPVERNEGRSFRMNADSSVMV